MNARKWVLSLFLVVVAMMLGGCGNQAPIPDDSEGETEDPVASDDNEAETEDPFADYVPDPDIFVAAPDAGMMVEQDVDDGRTIRYPVNQMLVLMNEDVAASAVTDLAADVDGTIVGQIPDIALYQIELATDTQADLEAAIALAEANSNVTAAGYNVEATLSQECPAESDNRAILQDDQCPFAEIEYYQALTMFEFFRPHLQLNSVAVGVIDTGLDPSTGEFDDANVFFLNNIAGPPTDSDDDLHGTAVSGMIGADDDGNGVNGIASRFLGNELSLVVNSGTDAATAMAHAGMAASAGARIINLSLGWEDTHSQFAVIRQGWVRTMARRSNVLFVAAAGNETLELDGTNYAPGGIDLPNLITVAATARCDPGTVASLSNDGSAVDIAAPGEEVPIITSGGLYLPDSGTSFAAPIVTSLAAILKSLRPTLTPAQIKTYITAHSLPLTDGSRFGRVTLTNSISQLLIDMSPGEPIESWLDPLGLGNHGASGLVLTRVCPPGILYQVNGYGSHSIYGPAEEVGLGFIGSAVSPPAFSLAADDDMANLFISSMTMTHFALDVFPIIAEPTGDEIAATFIDDESGDLGIGIAGAVTFETCRIDERDPFDGVDPWLVSVTGMFEGVFEVEDIETDSVSYHEFNGSFNIQTYVLALSDDELMEYLEGTCEGGIPHPTESEE